MSRFSLGARAQLTEAPTRPAPINVALILREIIVMLPVESRSVQSDRAALCMRSTAEGIRSLSPVATGRGLPIPSGCGLVFQGGDRASRYYDGIDCRCQQEGQGGYWRRVEVRVKNRKDLTPSGFLRSSQQAFQRTSSHARADRQTRSPRWSVLRRLSRIPSGCVPVVDRVTVRHPILPMPSSGFGQGQIQASDLVGAAGFDNHSGNLPP